MFKIHSLKLFQDRWLSMVFFVELQRWSWDVWGILNLTTLTSNQASKISKAHSLIPTTQSWYFHISKHFICRCSYTVASLCSDRFLPIFDITNAQCFCKNTKSNDVRGDRNSSTWLSESHIISSIYERQVFKFLCSRLTFVIQCQCHALKQKL